MLCVCRALAVLGWWSVTWLQHSLSQVTLPQTGFQATTVTLGKCSKVCGNGSARESSNVQAFFVIADHELPLFIFGV